MKRKTITDLRARVTIIVFVLFAGYSEAQTKTYNKFGFTFDYPADMTILVEKGSPSSDEEASEEAGVLRIGKPLTSIEVFWLSEKDAEKHFIWDVHSAFLSGLKESHSRKFPLGGFYLGDGMKSEQSGHKLWFKRICTERGAEGYSLHISGMLYCDRSQRIFIVTSSVLWEDVRLSMTFEIGEEPKKEPEWPDLETDPSYEVYEKVIDSFHCHSLTPPTEDRFNFQELKAKADTFFKNREVNTTVTMREEDGLANLYFDIKLDNIKDSETFNIVSILIILFVGESTMDIPWEQERTVIICEDEVIYWIHTTDCVAAHKASEEGNLEEMRKILNSKLHFWK